jgi:hypothetical protein
METSFDGVVEVIYIYIPKGFDCRDGKKRGHL